MKERVGTLDPKRLAKLDLTEAFTTKPAIHRFPGAMATRVRELAAVVAEDYGGDATRIWTEAADTADLKKRIGALPGFGEMKIKALGSLLAKQYGVAAAAGLAPGHHTLGDVTSPEELDGVPGSEAGVQSKAACRNALSSSGSARTARSEHAAGRGVGHLAVRRRAHSARSRAARRDGAGASRGGRRRLLALRPR